jgi:Bacterial regulatory helix-turn-helix protein, lysR family
MKNGLAHRYSRGGEAPSAKEAMQNIPTDLLRTLITVVDMRSFTRAAQVLGVTQPADQAVAVDARL